MDIANISECGAAYSNFASASRRNEAIQAYSKASLVNKSSKSYLKQITMDAISKWLNSDDIRVEFYFCKNKGEIRARIISEGKIGIGRDFSLYEFFSLGPVKV